MRLRTFAFALATLLAACGGDDGFTPTLDNPWHPPGPDHQAGCTDQCIPIVSNESHHGDLTVLANPADDSARAQWGKCFIQVMACWEPGLELATCTTAADRCPQPCRDEFVQRGGDVTDPDAQLAAFEGVFLDDDAPCRQPDAEVAP